MKLYNENNYIAGVVAHSIEYVRLVRKKIP